nr:hypothetical protein [Methanobacterium formicicum]
MEIIFLIGGALFLAYAGVLMLYYNIHSKEKKNRPQKLIAKGVMSHRRGFMRKPMLILKLPMNILKRTMIIITWPKHFIT